MPIKDIQNKSDQELIDFVNGNNQFMAAQMEIMRRLKISIKETEKAIDRFSKSTERYSTEMRILTYGLIFFAAAQLVATFVLNFGI
jgi:hypothetical protein